MKTVLFFALLYLAFVPGVLAQVMPVDTTNGNSYFILLTDGSHMHGRIIARDSLQLTVLQVNGQRTNVPRNQFSRLSNNRPVIADSVAYFDQGTTLSQPGQQTAAPGYYQVTLADGTLLNGRVLSQNDKSVVLETPAMGIVTIPAERVVRLERLAEVSTVAVGRGRRSVQGYENQFTQSMNFMPTAYQARKGQLYFRNTMLYISQFEYGLTDNWSLSTSFFTIQPSLFGTVSTKVSVRVGPSVRVGVQALLLYISIFGENTSSGFVQGLVSLGKPQKNVTIGLGIGTNRNSLGQTLTIGVVRKVSPVLTFISENILFINQVDQFSGKLSAGLRFDRQYHSFDLSANVPLGELGANREAPLIFIPTLSYQLRITR